MSDDIFDIERGGKKKDAKGNDVGTVVIVSQVGNAESELKRVL